ncbi:hypothetical protein BDF14DRAFT_1785602 [Spinellus fusiger]|nr:hypothetical protein BDF14DRAFT_1785602 [Spinellus fusiger]
MLSTLSSFSFSYLILVNAGNKINGSKREKVDKEVGNPNTLGISFLNHGIGIQNHSNRIYFILFIEKKKKKGLLLV